MNDWILEVNGAKYSYPDGRQALKGMNLKVSRGESVGIVGANGAGKSTLLMHFVGVLFPQEGEIRVGGDQVEKKSLPVIRQKLGLVFQDPDDQLFMPTVYEDVAFGPRNYRIPEETVQERVTKALETVGILHLKERQPYKLSGGEKRAATIASVLAMEPEILVMDEPTAALDPKSRRRLIHLLQTFEQTKIIATHDMDMVVDLCERTVILKDGQVIADGPTRKLLTDEKLMEESGLELPLGMQNCPICAKKQS